MNRTSRNPSCRSFALMTFVPAVLLFLVIGVSAGMGYLEIPFVDVLRIIAARIFGAEKMISQLDPTWAVVVAEVRLPRILAAAVVGGGLAVAGTVFQGILQNPLADPYTLGVSAGAAFGAAVALIFDIGIFGAYGVPVFAFFFAVATLFVVIFLAATGKNPDQFSSNNLILSGIIVAAILSAGLSFIKYLADEQVSVIIFWLMGSFAAMTWTKVILTAFFVGVGFCICLFYARDLNLMALGRKTAATSGVDTKTVTLVLLVTASMIAAACVSISGIIGFVGLLVPHMMRAFTGPDNRQLMPVSLLSGAVLLSGADTLTRAVLPGEIPIGVLTALIGGPFFCWIFRKRQMAGVGM